MFSISRAYRSAGAASKAERTIPVAYAEVNRSDARGRRTDASETAYLTEYFQRQTEVPDQRSFVRRLEAGRLVKILAAFRERGRSGIL